jgi:predicted enzyme related to lactoylglutathione lyase
MSDDHGRFVWYELMTTDVPAAKAFYGTVLGWGAQQSPVAGVDYTLFTVGQQPVAGTMALPEDARTAGAQPCWIGYVGVDDVDASFAQATAAGAAVYCAPRDIPTVGRFATIGDPQGAAIALFRFATPMPAPEVSPGTPGHIGWHELMTTDWPAAFAFYAALFGWTKGEGVDIGPLGTYQLFGKPDRPIGGMFNQPPEAPFPAWRYYFNVEDINAALARATAAGGTTLMPPMPVPGGRWVAQLRDPQGANFSLIAGHGA